MWTPAELSPKGPVYVAIADALASDVREGRLAPGARLPTHRELARSLGVNVATVTRAYQEAARRGLVSGEIGRGTFVREACPAAPPALLPLHHEAGGLIDFNFNLSAGDPAILGEAALFADLAADPTPARLQTGYLPAGFPEHRAAGARWVARAGVEADADRTLVCAGAQHALVVLLSALTEPGDVILTGRVTYAGVTALAGLLHLRAQGVAVDEHGIVPADLEASCLKGNPKLLYVQPTLQNPTGTILTEERRREVVAIARRHGLAIVEDDTYGFLCDDAHTPLAALAPDLTYFVTSTSKSIAAGLRVGYLVPPIPAQGAAVLSERLLAGIAATNWMAAPLMAEIATRWIEGGQAERMVAWKRAEARARRAIFDELLGFLPTPTDPRCFHVWMPLPEPWRGEDLAAEARAHGVALTPASSFAVGRSPAPHAVRVSLGRPATREATRRGLEVLAGLLDATPSCARPLV